MRDSLKLGLLLFLSMLTINCTNNKQSKSQLVSGKITVISVGDFKEKSLNQTMIDIRTPKEFREGHIEGSININFFDQNFLDQISKFDKNEPLFIYCRSGNRTSSASKKISKLGFKQVYDLEGGITKWTKGNNKIIK